MKQEIFKKNKENYRRFGASSDLLPFLAVKSVKSVAHFTFLLLPFYFRRSAFAARRNLLVQCLQRLRRRRRELQLRGDLL
jgi:hypothetical protein